MDAAEIVLELKATREIALPDDELRDLVAFLIEQGATREEIRSAGAGGRLGGLALDLALRQGPESFDFATAASQAGLEHAEVERVWTALGFPGPNPNGPRLDSATVDALRFLATVGPDLLGADYSLALARAIGTATARLAEAIVDAFRVRFEVPQLTAGVRYPEVVEEYVAVAAEHGTVVATNGDYYGNVVNLAARLAALADPGTALTTAALSTSPASVSAPNRFHLAR